MRPDGKIRLYKGDEMAKALNCSLSTVKKLARLEMIGKFAPFGEGSGKMVRYYFLPNDEEVC